MRLCLAANGCDGVAAPGKPERVVTTPTTSPATKGQHGDSGGGMHDMMGPGATAAPARRRGKRRAKRRSIGRNRRNAERVAWAGCGVSVVRD